MTERIEPAFAPGASVAVLGLGRSGMAAARLAHARGGRVYASDVGRNEAVEGNAAALREEGMEVEIGGHDLDRIRAADLVVVSPGIGPDTSVRRELSTAGVRTIAEVELAYRDVRSRLIGITGTNGKTTTSALAGHLLLAGGVEAVVAGNIGRPLAEIALLERHPAWVVVELSSFQLADLELFTPDIGLLLNLSPDHLDRYRDVAAYYADKQRLFANAGPGSRWVLNADDELVLDLAKGAEGEHFLFSVGGPVERGAYLAADGWLHLRLGERSGRWTSVSELKLVGRHNAANALAAGLAAALVGCADREIASGLREFEALPHRLQPIGERNDVLWVNDSKATNVAASAVALRAFDRPVVLLLGGRHKGEPYTSLIPELRRHGRAIVAYGEAAPYIVADLREEVSTIRVESTLESTVRAAGDLAEPGDVVLLSPACSSYDLFPDYEERGRAFERAFLALDDAAPRERVS
ncbi:MAG: UDP-N-acetylmuramoyl-L-alanine--D-glutamate ligase [Gemmatimonadota bacterium]